MNAIRKCLAVFLSTLGAAPLGWAQEPYIAPVRPSVPGLVRPYFPVDAPPVRLSNSPRLAALVRGGILYLSADDAIALALENNIDIESVRYTPLILAWNLTRAQAGGLLPGVPSPASQAGTVASGQGVLGSQQAAGVSIPGSTSGRTQSTNATISQVGAVTQTLDPIIQESSTFSHTTAVQPNSQQSFTGVLVSDTRTHNASIQQGLLTGGSLTLTYTGHWLNENAETDILNPSSAPSLSISVQHNLLQGFGRAVNERTITVARMNRDSADLNFRITVSNVIAQVLNAYYSLAATYEDVKAKSLAAETAATLLADVRERARVGTVAPSDVIVPESQSVSAEQARVLAETTLQQQELQIKNLLSRDGTADPILRTVSIVPVDPVRIPDRDDLPPVAELVAQALANRPDLASEKENLAAGQINNLGTRSAVLPTAIAFGSASAAGLAGTANPIVGNGFTLAPPDTLVGGLGTALGQVFRHNYPSERVGAAFLTPLRNRQALADYAIDELTLRQSQLRTRKDFNQVEVDIGNYVTALRQARAHYEAALRNRVLQEELFTAERRRMQLGASIPYNVTQQQRDLIAAQSSEMAARVSYVTARIGLDYTTGMILSANHVSIEEAHEGKVSRQSTIRETPQQ
ncbi:MAG TPA: TolC family protein [Candidatus Acidoferrales bacterium]|nr:TolC family protein [Candidatus Acidoferrales bacterium]